MWPRLTSKSFASRAHQEDICFLKVLEEVSCVIKDMENQGTPSALLLHTHEPCQVDCLGDGLQRIPGQRLSAGRRTGWVPTRVWGSDSQAPAAAAAWAARGGGGAFSTRPAPAGGFCCGAGRFAGHGLLLVHVMN